MENQKSNNQGEEIAARMSAEDVAIILSQAMRDLAEKKTTLRHAMVVSRVALALAKVIEVTDLKERVELLEQVIGKRTK